MDGKKQNGGPAFPETRWDDIARQNVQWMGMTLRDYFAGKVVLDAPYNKFDFDATAKWAYKLADAMLEARNK